MRVSVGLAANGSEDWQSRIDFAVEAERLGVHSIWTAETWGHDAVTPLAYVASHTSTVRLGTGILQNGARTPANVAMTAMAMHSMTGGRFLLGVGASGPQVVEGWHGVSYRRPLQRTRELIEIVRMVTRGERVAYDGQVYQLPLPGGEGKPLRSSAPVIEDLPIYIASLGPANLRLTGELADGWIGTSFVPETADIFIDELRIGAEAAGRSLDDLDLQVGGAVEFTDDVEAAAQRHAMGLAFSLGAMGSAQHNFYNDAYRRQGWEDDAKAVQRLWIEGKRDEARAAVPIEMALKVNLLGTPEMVKERLRLYRDAGITTFRAGVRGDGIGEQLEHLGQLMDLVREVNAEVANPA
jgi:F420-dependent oxidoreductase-like protein